MKEARLAVGSSGSSEFLGFLGGQAASSPSRPWLILRRVEEGSIFIPDDEPYACDVFDTLNAASSYMGAMDTCHAPIILNVPDGRTLVTSLSDCGKAAKRRSMR
ncbi:MAG TPA: hypothetical protein VF432_14055 [Thermoanaerobaculia bacterium]